MTVPAGAGLAQLVPLTSAQQTTDKFGGGAPASTTTGATTTTASQVPTTAPAVGGGEIPVPAPDDELVYLNATDVDIKDMIKQISKATGTNFLLDDKLRGKVTIISEKPMTKDMAYQAFLSALEVMGYTIVKSPAGLVKVVATKDALTEPIDLYKDQSPDTDRFITRIIQVKNISANDLSSVVKGLVSKEGNMFAYPATNSLIITDSGSNIDRILKIIKELDQEGPQEVIEIVPILNADAGDVTEKILALFEQEAGRGGAASRVRNRGRGAAEELEDTPNISKVISDERTNSVIILGSKRSIAKVRALIARLDTAVSGSEGTIHVYYLKHAVAKDLAEVLSSFVGGGSKDSKTKKSGGGAAAPQTGANAGAASAQLEGGVKVTADDGTNSLVITASPKDYQTLMDEVISKLDIPRRQVYLEAVIMELSVNKNRTIGVNGNFGSIFNLADSSFTGFGSILPITPTTLSNIAGAQGGLGAGMFSNKTIDFTVGDKTVKLPAVSAILQALQTDSNVNVLSTPSILTLDNEEASIQVGSEVPVKSGTSIASGGIQNFNVTREDTGIILKITPQISESDTVRLKIEQEISGIEGENEDGPIFSKKNVDTVVVANDKQTIVIGGLIDDTSKVTSKKVPYLGDVPVLGNLFKTKSTEKAKHNIIVFITPYIIRDRSDYLDILRKKIEERNLFIDMNYGVGQKKQIRQSIKTHANDLLEFKAVLQQDGALNPVAVSPPTVTDQSPPPASKEVSADSGKPTNSKKTHKRSPNKY